MGDANRANATFYTVDPRGLPVFDTPIGPAPPPSLTADYAMLRGRLDSLKTLAENTDGMTVQNSNDLDIGLKRIAVIVVLITSSATSRRTPNSMAIGTTRLK